MTPVVNIFRIGFLKKIPERWKIIEFCLFLTGLWFVSSPNFHLLPTLVCSVQSGLYQKRTGSFRFTQPQMNLRVSVDQTYYNNGIYHFHAHM